MNYIQELSENEIKILHEIQRGLPLLPRPYKVFRDMTEMEVIALIKKFKKEKVIRRISALFNSKRLGYVSTLVAMRVAENKLDSVSAIINEYNEVTHNYERDDKYNLWFTLTASSNDKLERLIAEIKEKTGNNELLNLPTMNRFRINTIFRIPGYAEKEPLDTTIVDIEAPAEIKEYTPIAIDDLDKKILGELQNIPIDCEPYLLISKRLKISQQELFQRIEMYKKTGIIRKIRAVLDHYKIGLNENVLAVFKVTSDEIQKAIEIVTSFYQVTHCYERLTSGDWTYNLFAVIHETTRQECDKVIAEILEKTGIKEYKKLYTKREWKKANPRYF